MQNGKLLEGVWHLPGVFHLNFFKWDLVLLLVWSLSSSSSQPIWLGLLSGSPSKPKRPFQ